MHHVVFGQCGPSLDHTGEPSRMSLCGCARFCLCECDVRVLCECAECVYVTDVRVLCECAECICVCVLCGWLMICIMWCRKLGLVLFMNCLFACLQPLATGLQLEQSWGMFAPRPPGNGIRTHTHTHTLTHNYFSVSYHIPPLKRVKWVVSFP